MQWQDSSEIVAAEYAVVTIGSMSGAGKDAVDLARDAGEKVGLIKVKTFRPFR